MRLALSLHPDSRCAAVAGIEVEITRLHANRLALRYAVTGDIGAVQLAPRAAAVRAAELWRHTCFETFIRAESGEDYYELNFAPSTEWAAYHFTSWRAGMRAADEISAPDLYPSAGAGAFELRVTLALDQMTWLQQAARWRLALSAVIEETNGEKSYWALAHAPGKPDFHNAAAFAYDMPAPERP